MRPSLTQHITPAPPCRVPASPEPNHCRHRLSVALRVAERRGAARVRRNPRRCSCLAVQIRQRGTPSLYERGR
ncbi:hypothetical protein E2C01_062967 [Portunus trituberculatus]|uniref:Uncharacterized protein n=1 Tax=Portunus trituberculatus TaxID=210409 RepID=A0A5B7HGA0_PORTR|nr:hypothetical protein [Portunus trituberculatus]